MLKRIDPHHYPPRAYDDEWCLKPPPLLWVALIYLARGLVLPPLMGLAHWAGVNPDALTVLRGVWQPPYLIPALLALPIICAAFRRVPQAPNALRWIWRQGRMMIILAVVADLAVNVWSLIQVGDLDDASVLPVGGVLFDLYLLAYLAFVARVRDTFKDFPPRPTTTPTA